MKTQRTESEADSPCLMFWRLRGSLLSVSLQNGFLCLACTHSKMASETWEIQAPRRKLHASLCVPIPGHWPRDSVGQRVRCPCHFRELKAGGSGGLLVAQGQLWDWQVAGSQVDIYMWSMEFGVTVPGRVLGSSLQPWLGAPGLDSSLLGISFHRPRGASRVQDCSHYTQKLQTSTPLPVLSPAQCLFLLLKDTPFQNTKILSLTIGFNQWWEDWLFVNWFWNYPEIQTFYEARGSFIRASKMVV